MKKMTHVERVGSDLLEATAYGDSAGLPVENMTPDQIQEVYGPVSKLLPPSDHPMFIGEELAGVWSDDTQLTIAVADSLIEADGFDIESQAEHLIAAYRDTPQIEIKGKLVPRGWGGSTMRSVERLLEGISPLDSGEPHGSGNGVVMKLAPLVFWQVAREVEAEERYMQYDQLTCMTHLGERAIWASRVHGDLLFELLSAESSYDMPAKHANLVVDASREHEKALDLDAKGTDLLSYLRLPEIADNIEAIGQYTDGRGFYVPQTLGMAYGIFMHHAYDFESAVYKSVNLGGDTDSIASIAAVLWNFYEREEFVMPEDHELLVDRSRLVALSKRFTDKALRRSS